MRTFTTTMAALLALLTAGTAAFAFSPKTAPAKTGGMMHKARKMLGAKKNTAIRIQNVKNKNGKNTGATITTIHSKGVFGRKKTKTITTPAAKK